MLLAVVAIAISGTGNTFDPYIATLFTKADANENNLIDSDE